MSNFDENGKYNKTNWKTGDELTADKLNKIEESLEIINNNDIERHKEADERLDALEEQNEAVEEELNNKATKDEVSEVVDGFSGEIESINSQLARIENTKVNYFITPEMFGAVGDGVTDDRQAIQDAIDYCSFNGKELRFEKKTYLCYSLTAPSGIKIDGGGGTLKKPNLSAEPYNMDAGSMKWIRLLSITHNDILDSENTIIENLNFDGNCWTMWKVEDGYSQEQASLLIANANNNNPGRLNLTINNCTFVNNVSDGIHTVQNVKATITNCRSTDCFRGGLVITGGNSTITVDNFIFESPNINDGIDIEIDTAGYGGSMTSQISLNNIIIDDDLDVVATDDSIIILNNIIMKGESLYFGSHGELYVSNSTLRPSNNISSRLLISGKGKMKFSNVKFEGVHPENGACLPIQFHNNTEDGSLVEFINCSFYGGTAGIQGASDAHTKVFFNSCYFDSSITGIAIGEQDGNVHFAPHELHVSDCVFDNPGYAIKCLSSGSTGTTMYITNINITNPDNLGVHVHQPTIIYDVVLFNGYYTTYSKGANPSVYGRRVLFVDDDPNILQLTGYKNIDIAILKSDKTQRWEYSHQNVASPWDHVWISI